MREDEEEGDREARRKGHEDVVHDPPHLASLIVYSTCCLGAEMEGMGYMDE